MSAPMTSALLGAGAVVIWNDVAESGRRQFYDWHDKEHIPERLAIPGFRRGRRYVRPGHSPEWLTLYEADDLDVVRSPEYLKRLNAPTPASGDLAVFPQHVAGRVPDRPFDRLQQRRPRARHACAAPPPRLAEGRDVASAHGDALVRHLGTEVFPAAMDMTGVVACHLYAADRDASFVDTAESRTREFDVPAWVLLAEATTPPAADDVRRSIEDAAALRRLGVRVRADAATYALEICRLAVPARDPSGAAHSQDRRAHG